MGRKREQPSSFLIFSLSIAGRPSYSQEPSMQIEVITLVAGIQTARINRCRKNTCRQGSSLGDPTQYCYSRQEEDRKSQLTTVDLQRLQQAQRRWTAAAPVAMHVLLIDLHIPSERQFPSHFPAPIVLQQSRSTSQAFCSHQPSRWQRPLPTGASDATLPGRSTSCGLLMDL
jgi:hypothetical protein